MDISAIAYAGLEVIDATWWEKVAPDAFGLEVGDPGADGSVRLRLDDRPFRVAVRGGDRDGLDYLGWELAHDRALDEAVGELSELGVQVDVGDAALRADRQVARAAAFRDPFGFRHELVVGQRTRPGSFRPVRPVGGFVTGHRGFGHVVLVVPDRRAAVEFYRGVMGFELSDIVSFTVPAGFEIEIQFLHVNRRHHSLAFVTIPGMRGVEHLMFEARQLDDVGVAWERCHHHEVPISLGLGRHTNDRMISFYARTPSGMDVEVGYGAIEIDDDWVVATYDSGHIWGHRSEAEEHAGALEPVPTDGGPA